MKILFVTEDLANGGSERVVSVLANELGKSNQVGVVAIRRDRVLYQISPNVLYYPFLHENAGKVTRTVGRLRLLIKAIRTFKPDVVIAFDMIPVVYSLVCCKYTKTKLIISERADPARHNRKSFIGNRYFRAFYEADGVVFQTPDAKSFFTEEIRKKSTVIPNPINDKFVFERYTGIRKKEIVTACRLTKQKNLKLFIDIVLDVCRKHPDYLGIIYGEGPELVHLQEYVKECDAESNIVFAGHSDSIVSDIYKSRFYLCTSDYEGISNSLLEAMTLGLTVLSTDCPVGGARMAITSGENGILFPVGYKEDAVKEIEDLIANEKKADCLGANASTIKDRWSVSSISQKWIEYICTICE